MTKYYVSRGKSRLYNGKKVDPATKGFNSLDKAREYGCKLVSEYIGKKDKVHGIGLDIAFIMKDSPDNEEFATVQWGKPNLYYPEGFWYITWPKNGNNQEYLIQKNGLIIKRYM